VFIGGNTGVVEGKSTPDNELFKPFWVIPVESLLDEPVDEFMNDDTGDSGDGSGPLVEGFEFVDVM
jgi:hypothetical protein